MAYPECPECPNPMEGLFGQGLTLLLIALIFLGAICWQMAKEIGLLETELVSAKLGIPLNQVTSKMVREWKRLDRALGGRDRG